MTPTRTPPPYSEEQATIWLAWLAHNMRRRDMTIFQIENLQPDWLAGRKETVLHLLLTRALWGMWGGLIGGLFSGLIVGLFFGLIELATPIYKLDTFLRTHANPTRSLVIGSLAGGLIGRLIFGLIDWLFFGLSVGLSVGFVRTVRISLREVSQGILTVESLRWSWQYVRQNVRKGSIFGLIFGLFFGLIGRLFAGLFAGIFFGLIDWLISGLIFGLIFGLIGGLIGGFQPGAEELKTRPNQGIWLTIRSSLKIGLSSGLSLHVCWGSCLRTSFSDCGVAL